MSDFLPGLQDALHRARTSKGTVPNRSQCTLCIVVRHATPGVSREALEAAAAGSISGRALHRSLRSIGVSISRESIIVHRNESHTP